MRVNKVEVSKGNERICHVWVYSLAVEDITPGGHGALEGPSGLCVSQPAGRERGRDWGRHSGPPPPLGRCAFL